MGELKCETCQLAFALDFLLEAHRTGHTDALEWANKTRESAFEAEGLSVDELDTFDELLSSDEADDSMETSYNFSAIANGHLTIGNGKSSSNNNANNNSVNDDDDEVLALPSLEQKFDPMMDSGDSDLPDLEELPAPGGSIEEKSRRPGLRKRRAAKSESDDETEDDMDVKTDMLMDDEEIKEDKDEEFVLEPLEASQESKNDEPDEEISEEEVLKAKDREIQIVYASGAPKPCKYCDKKFRSLAQLAQHERCHTGEKPFVCKHCSKSFRQKAHLTTHLRIHTGERPFNCKLCGKGFIQSQHLKNHKRLHTGEKPFQCKVCHKFFSQISNLRHHERSHRKNAARQAAMLSQDGESE